MGRPKGSKNKSDVNEDKSTGGEEMGKVKVVDYSDYLGQARDEIAEKPDKFKGKMKIDRAIELLYENNEVVDTVVVKGQTKFVCEA